MTTVGSYTLRAANGRRIRTATKVIFDDGSEVRFVELMPARLALAQAEQMQTQGLPSEAFAVVELTPLRRVMAAAGDLLRGDPRLARALERAAREV